MRARTAALLLFLTDIAERAAEEPQEKEAPVLQESSNGEQTRSDGGNSGLKSVLSADSCDRLELFVDQETHSFFFFFF